MAKPLHEKLKEFLQDDPVQSGAQLRAYQRAQKISALLIDQKIPLEKALQELKQTSLPYFDHPTDRLYIDHQLAVLQELSQDPIVWKKIQNFSSSYLLPSVDATTLKKAILSALLIPLRQAIGSCFATAPAIMIQRHHVQMFVEDIEHLLSRGSIKRMIEGEEIAAPINSIPFQSNPLDLALLRSWEYTLATFSDYKLDFTKASQLNCLGMHPEQRGGIGQIIFSLISDKLEEANKTIQKYQSEVEENYHQLKMAESFFNEASSYTKAQRHKREWQIQSHQFDTSLHMRDDAHKLAKNYAGFFNFIADRIAVYFSEFFQEIYDPDLLQSKAALFEDTPAGFRLIYKHGRLDPSLWTTIKTAQEYIDSLTDFFKMIEGRIIADCDWDEGKEDIAAIMTEILLHLQESEFIETAQKRAIETHVKARTGAEHQTPWSYVSGGSMESLLKCYFKALNPIQKEQKTIQSCEELLIFFTETLKNAPPKLTTSPLYAHSPSHAFLLHPEFFKQAWLSKQFTYTWVKEQLIAPAQNFYENILLTPEDQAFLSVSFLLNPGSMDLKISEFRALLADQAPDKLTEIDSMLISSLPLYNPEQILKIAECELDKDQMSKVQTLLKGAQKITALELQDLFYALTKDPGFTDKLRTLGYLAPKPVFVGDTNWPNMLFAFAYNPGTHELGLWRTDPGFRIPKPMYIWQQDLTNGNWAILMQQF